MDGVIPKESRERCQSTLRYEVPETNCCGVCDTVYPVVYVTTAEVWWKIMSQVVRRRNNAIAAHKPVTLTIPGSILLIPGEYGDTLRLRDGNFLDWLRITDRQD